MMKFNKYSLAEIFRVGFFVVIISFFISLNVHADAKEKETNSNKVQKSATTQSTLADPITSVVDVNNITSFVDSKGYHNNIIGASYNGTFPKGTAGVVYQEGIVWGGKVNDGGPQTIRVGGNTYNSGTKSLDRLYRVRPDYETADLTDDAANFFIKPQSQVTDGDIQQLRTQYEKDWLEWPADKGAPYDDVDGNGVYDPNVDIPGVPGASQTLVIRYNDANAGNTYGSDPIGLEVQETYWAYAISNPLGNAIFKKVNIVYTGTANTPDNATIEDMYLSQWADTDLGTYTDDYAAVDTSLNLGYTYNSTTADATYFGLGLAPPAAGYDFLQGVAQYTGDPADSAIINLKWRKGYKYVNKKPMSTFVYFAAGGSWEDPTLQDYEGTLQWYNLLRGYQPLVTETPFPTNTGGTIGGDNTYLLAGDPVTGTGWLDGVVEGAGDRRICNVTGPFTMAKGDSVEIVVALLAGLGSNNITSVSVLKFADRFVQFAYDNLFDLPIFPAPTVEKAELDNKVVLNWGFGQDLTNEVENAAPKGYKFQGYNVYQLPTPSASLSSAIKIATYDVIDEVTTILDDQLDEKSGEVLKLPVQLGKNTGITRTISITEDKVRNQPLRNGQEYYFAVTAYGYNPDPTLPFNALESNLQLITAIPQDKPGVRYEGSTGDTLQVSHATGNGDGSLVPVVVDPSAVTGHSYEVSFDDTGAQTVWKLTDLTTGKVKIDNQENQTGDDDYLIVDGIMVKVLGPSVGLNGIVQETQDGTLVDGTISIYDVALGPGGYILNNAAGDVNLDPYDPDFDRFGYRGTDDVIINFGEQSLTWDYISEEVHMDNGAPYMAPYSVYRIKADGTVIRLFAGFWDTDSTGTWTVDATDPSFGKPAYEQMFAWQGYDADGNEISYDPANDAQYVADNALSVSANTTWGSSTGEFTYPYLTNTLVTLYLDGADYPAGDIIRFTTNKTNSSRDTYTFTAPKVDENAELAKEDAKLINVFPNPYYGTQYRETTRQGKYVTFSHLPQKADIRIFDLSGVLVRTINKDDNSQFTQWDLTNSNNYPVASGIYVVYVECPDLGTSKILKLAIVQEEQILNIY